MWSTAPRPTGRRWRSRSPTPPTRRDPRPVAERVRDNLGAIDERIARVGEPEPEPVGSPVNGRAARNGGGNGNGNGH